jgi:NTE family protein
MTATPIPNTPSPSAPRVSLALQGGGSHGAFTWGVLDALLEDGRVGLEGISGTSAGAMNAVALAHGFAQTPANKDPRDAARESLSHFWNGVASLGGLSPAQQAPFDLLFGHINTDNSPAAVWGQAMTAFWSSAVSPYQSNPFDLNPLRGFLDGHIDFEAIQRLETLKLFVVATRVSTGQAEVFSGDRLTVDAVMASACLPTVFQAVEIEGDHFWDGGYSGNPAIHPLIYHCTGRDIVLVQINPIKRDKLPTNSAEIMDRINEVTFNAGLIAEMRAIDFVKRLLAEGRLDPTHYKDVLLHRIDGGEALEAYAASTKASTGGKLIHALRDLGQVHGRTWLATHFNDLGVRCTVDIKRDYLDDLRVPVKRRTLRDAI